MKQEIKVNRYVIHFLDKEKNNNQAKVDFSNKISISDEFSITLADEIHKSISGSPSLKNTKFKEKSENDFSYGGNGYATLTMYKSGDAKVTFYANENNKVLAAIRCSGSVSAGRLFFPRVPKHLSSPCGEYVVWPRSPWVYGNGAGTAGGRIAGAVLNGVVADSMSYGNKYYYYNRRYSYKEK